MVNYSLKKRELKSFAWKIKRCVFLAFFIVVASIQMCPRFSKKLCKDISNFLLFLIFMLKN